MHRRAGVSVSVYKLFPGTHYFLALSASLEDKGVWETLVWMLGLAWKACLETTNEYSWKPIFLLGMMNVVRRTGHSSYYVEKGIGAMGKTPKEMGIRSDYTVNGGGT